ncbi:MAG: CapA family protein [Nitrospiraceae bacterium]|nr:CapA family protein [Nitrospiraceae bacterium]
MRLFICGDVMTGRGIDQTLPHPNNARIYESFMESAIGYVELAERKNGPIPRQAGISYIWGDALEELKRFGPDFSLINLETAVTKNEEHEYKGINYRMHPGNVGCLKAAGIDCCSLANNHILDLGYPGLEETLETLKKAGIRYAGAGGDLEEAEASAILEHDDGGRVLVFSFGHVTSGIPLSWAAAADRPGVNLLPDLSNATALKIKKKVEEARRKDDIVIASIHWGPNWGYEVQKEQRKFAREIIDKAGIDIIHGHSSHHIKGIEVYKKRLILYGCGDFINDYEGILGYEQYRGDLGLMYLVSVESPKGALLSVQMIPTRVRRFRVELAVGKDGLWLMETLNREGAKLGTNVEENEDGSLILKW